MSLLIIAVDPGTTESALVSWDTYITRIVNKRTMLNEDMLAWLRENIRGCDHVVVERLQCFGMPVGAEVFETAYLIGQIKELCFERGVECTPVTRVSVKVHHCHDSKAKDANIRQALIDRLGPVGTKKNPGPCYGISGDLWSALAIAIYAHDQFASGTNANASPRGGAGKTQLPMKLTKRIHYAFLYCIAAAGWVLLYPELEFIPWDEFTRK